MTRGSIRLALAAGLVLGCGRRPVPEPAPEIRLLAAPRQDFARATAPRSFSLPRDHGPHFDYQTEWWYYTGNLAAVDGRRFGYQLTIFRRGLTPGPPPSGTGLATNQVYLGHLALTDAALGRHLFAERRERGAAGLAGAEPDPYRVFLEGWRVESQNADGSAVHLCAGDPSGIALDLHLRSRKPLVAHGEMGLSPKSEEPGNASYYLGYTRMETEGRLGGRTPVAVSGASWFDHEWSTSALGPAAVGWDWFSLQLDDDRELMFFEIRRDDGTVERVSGGTLVEPDGSVRRLGVSAVDLGVVSTWTSPATGASYPARWVLAVPSEGLRLTLEPLIPDQEMRTSFVYWEGAVRITGAAHGRPVTGWGYVEMTGYAGSMQGVL